RICLTAGGAGNVPTAGGAGNVPTAGVRLAAYGVADDADPQVPGFLQRGQVLLEPLQLRIAQPAVVPLGEVRLGHGRVETGDGELEVVDDEQRPGLARVEHQVIQLFVKLAKQAVVVTPLGKIRRVRLPSVRLAVSEVRLAGQPG